MIIGKWTVHQLTDSSPIFVWPGFDFFAIIELMTSRSYLGEFELMLLLAVVHLGDDAYGVPISRELEAHRGRDVSLGSVYAALERLEAKGLVVSTLGNPTPERGGKAKRYFRITKEGLRQVHETRRVLTELWRKLPELNPADRIQEFAAWCLS